MQCIEEIVYTDTYFLLFEAHNTKLENPAKII